MFSRRAPKAELETYTTTYKGIQAFRGWCVLEEVYVLSNLDKSDTAVIQIVQ